MSEVDYHGWSGHDVLAYFLDEDAARRFLEDMDAMLWVGPVRVDGGASEVVNAPHLLTDEMVERAARALHAVSDDVLPFDLSAPKGMRGRQTLIDQRRERYLTAARAALEAALGGAA